MGVACFWSYRLASSVNLAINPIILVNKENSTVPANHISLQNLIIYLHSCVSVHEISSNLEAAGLYLIWSATSQVSSCL